MLSRIGYGNFENLANSLCSVIKTEKKLLIPVFVGCAIYTFGLMAFIVPYHFPDSGVTGIAILLNYRFGISLSITVAVANALLLIWAWRQLSPRVVIWTIIGVGIMSVMMRLMQGMVFIETEHKLLVAIIGGAVMGYGSGITLRYGLSMGGTEIVALYLQKKYGIEIGKYIFYIDMLVIGASAFILGVENSMFGLVSIYAASVMIDSTVSSFDRRRQIFVVTRNPQPVIDFIIQCLDRSATIIGAYGAYSREERPIVMTILSRRQSVDLKRFLAENQKDAFIVFSDASEVIGEGFKSLHH